MNKYFINIKVDREERPDIDSIYMQAVLAQNGHGGWPMTVFLTPEKKIVTVVLNDSNSKINFNIILDGKDMHSSLNAGAVGTFILDIKN